MYITFLNIKILEEFIKIYWCLILFVWLIVSVLDKKSRAMNFRECIFYSIVNTPGALEF